MTTALATGTMFQTAYRQITPHERSFVDMVVREIVEWAKRAGRRIADFIGLPLPDEIHKRDTRGYLTRPMVLAAITEKLQEIQHYKDVSLDTVIRQLHAIATFSLKEIVKHDELGDPHYDLTALTEDQWAAIESIEIDKNETGLDRRGRIKVKIKRESKLMAIKQLTDLLGGPDALNSYQKAGYAKTATALPASATAEQAGDAYAAMIGDD